MEAGFPDQLQWFFGNFGAKYLGFFKSHSLKTRKKHIKFFSVFIFFEGIVFTFQFLNDKIHNLFFFDKIVNLSFKNWKVDTLPSKNIQTEQNWHIFLSFWENERRKKPKYFAPLSSVSKFSDFDKLKRHLSVQVLTWLEFQLKGNPWLFSQGMC